MNNKVETELKYYCMEPEMLIQMASKMGFKKVKSKTEADEYFTDINSEFIKNRTCLRIRKIDKDMEITFKGKSNSFFGVYCKEENNIDADITEYDKYVKLFTSLGYYSYVKFEKQREVYTKTTDEYEYNIMIDTLPEIGGFVEFEIMSLIENSTRNVLVRMLNKFVAEFSELNLKEATEPYRDIVANYIYNQHIQKELHDVYINVDNTLAAYEKRFFKEYKDQIIKKTGTNIRWGIYKMNKSVEVKISSLIEEYIENLIFDSKELITCADLLNKLPCKIHVITRVNQVFLEKLRDKLGIKIDDVIYVDESNRTKSTKNIKTENSAVLTGMSLKDINSALLIMINKTTEQNGN